jgi:flagellar P-ring protein precursor FlgI
MLILAPALYGQETVRIKDIAYIHGVRENQLTGFGIVTGLAGKGDSSNNVLLKTVLSNLFTTFGVNIPPNDIKSKNCAVVMVTADIPPFVRPGDRISVTISSVADAKSLEGGVLLQTNLRAANENVYAVAQGKLVITQRNESVKTVGTVPGGAIIEREVLSSIDSRDTVSIALYRGDLATIYSIAQKIRESFPDTEVFEEDASLLRVAVPEEFQDNWVAFIVAVESLQVTPDSAAKVVVNPRSGVVVMGKEVKIGKVAVSYKGDKISIGAGYGFQEEQKEQFVLDDGTTVDDLVTIMQEIGIKTDVIIEILKAIDQAGALYGKLEIM